MFLAVSQTPMVSSTPHKEVYFFWSPSTSCNATYFYYYLTEIDFSYGFCKFRFYRGLEKVINCPQGKDSELQPQKNVIRDNR